MESIKDFRVGQRVKMFNSLDRCDVYGHVIEIKPDPVKALGSVLIKWNDDNDLHEHYEQDFKNIKNGIPTA